MPLNLLKLFGGVTFTSDTDKWGPLCPSTQSPDSQALGQTRLARGASSAQLRLLLTLAPPPQHQSSLAFPFSIQQADGEDLSISLDHANLSAVAAEPITFSPFLQQIDGENFINFVGDLLETKNRCDKHHLLGNILLIDLHSKV
jgi:hypothetical protein